MNRQKNTAPPQNKALPTAPIPQTDDSLSEQDFSLEAILAEFGSKPEPPTSAPASKEEAAAALTKHKPDTLDVFEEKGRNTGRKPPEPEDLGGSEDLVGLDGLDQPGKRADSAPLLLPEDVSVAPVEAGPVIDISAFDAVYERKQQRILVLRKRLLAAEKAESKRKRKNPPPVVAAAVKTGPIPLPPGMKAQLDRDRAARKAPLRPGPEKPPERKQPPINPLSLLRKLDKKKSSLALRMSLVLVLCAPMFYLAAADALFLPAFPGSSPASDPFLHTVLSLSLLVACMLLGLDVMVSGAARLLLLRPSADSLVLLSAAASVGHCATYLLSPPETLFAPLCLLPALGIFMSLLASNLSLKNSIRSLRSCYKLQRSKVLAPLPEQYDNDDIYALANAKSFQGFYRSFTERDAAETTMLWFAPLMAVAALFLAVYCAVGTGKENGPPFFWCWSLMMSLTPALGFFLSTVLPYAGISKRLFKNGVLLGGRKAVSRMASRSFVLLTDEELFPGDGISINGYKLTDPSRKEEALSCAASVLDAAHTALARPFVRLAADEYAPIRPVSQLKFNEMGGILALVDDRQVMVGTGSFIQRCGIKIPPDIKLRTAVFCAVDAQLVAVFAVKYQALPRSDYALSLLTENGYIPVLATRDFNVTASFLQSRFGIPSGDVVYPAADLRATLSDPGLTLEAGGVVVTRGAGDCVAEALVACGRFKAAGRAGIVFSLLSSLLGLGLSTLMAYHLWDAAAAPLNLLIYYVLWLVPVLLLSGWSNKF